MFSITDSLRGLTVAAGGRKAKSLFTKRLILHVQGSQAVMRVTPSRVTRPHPQLSRGWGSGSWGSAQFSPGFPEPPCGRKVALCAFNVPYVRWGSRLRWGTGDGL